MYRAVRWDCNPRPSSHIFSLLKAPPPVGLRLPYAVAFKATRRRQTNRNHRKLSHKEWAETWGPITSNKTPYSPSSNGWDKSIISNGLGFNQASHHIQEGVACL